MPLNYRVFQSPRVLFFTVYLTKKSWDLEKELDAFKFYLQASHKIKLLCKNTHILVDDLITEAETMEDIRVKARLNLPSEHMFPPQMILEKLRILGWVKRENQGLSSSQGWEIWKT